MPEQLQDLPYPLEEIEDGLVLAYVEDNKLTVRKNQLIAEVIKRAQPNQPLRQAIDNLIGPVTIEKLIIAFELLIPDDDRKLNGAFFTPPEVAAFLAKKTINRADDLICDPSCGCGAILLGAAQYQARKFKRPLSTIIASNIFGVDLCDYNIRRSRLLLNLAAIAADGDQGQIDVQLRQANSLDSDFSQLFPAAFAEQSGFDAVVGNPPYVRFQHLDERVRVDLQRFQTIDQGNYNLYLPFYELGEEILADGGRLAYITPNAFFSVKSAQAFRAWAKKKAFLNQIYDFSDHKVFQVSAYTCIAIGEKGKRHRSIRYARLNSNEQLNKSIATSSVSYASLNQTRWNMISTATGKTIDKINNHDHIPLGQLVDIRGGLATLRDSLYLAEREGNQIYKHFEGDSYPIEAAITRPLVKVTDFQNQDQLAENKRVIIFPYQVGDQGVEVIEEKVLANDYPLAYRYLNLIKPSLAERDRGKKEYPAWYAYGRSQGLLPLGPCLYTPIYAAAPRFLQGGQSEELFINGLALTLKPDQPQPFNLDLLAALLNQSAVLDFYMSSLAPRIAGGYTHYQTALLKTFPIPQLTGKQADRLLNGDRRQRERLINKLYQLSNSDLN